MTGACRNGVGKSKRAIRVVKQEPYVHDVILPTKSSVTANPVLLRCCVDQGEKTARVKVGAKFYWEERCGVYKTYQEPVGLGTQGRSEPCVYISKDRAK